MGIRACSFLLLAAVVVGCGSVRGGTESESSTTGAVNLAGAITLLQEHQVLVDESGLECAGTGQFNDVRPGAEVVVSNDSGRVLARAGLVVVRGTPKPPQCDYRFSIDELPAASSYSFRLGARDLGRFSRADLAARSWQVRFAIGP